MKTNPFVCMLAGLIALAPLAKAEDSPSPTPSAKMLEAENIVKNLKYKQGDIDLQNGIAKLSIPQDFKYLDAADAKSVLVKVWGNPPEGSADVIGMILPANLTPMDDGAWAVTIAYNSDGYVKDDDYGKIDFNDELKKMQAGMQENNKVRVDKGYPPIQLIGWATPPHYDSATHKLYWAKELKFGDDTENTLNYDIRILGRRGVLVLSAISGMSQLPVIEQNNPKILAMVNFNDGNRYQDFDPKIDKVAAYGIGALVLGTVAAKAGLFKLILIGLLAMKKFVIIAFAAVAAFFRRIFGGRKKQT